MHLASRFLTSCMAAALLAFHPAAAASADASSPPDGNGPAAADSVAGPRISWNGDVADFGSFDKAKTQSHVFSFSNTGSEPLMILKVFTDCGCTTVDYPKHPVAPGDSASITVSYQSVGKTNGYFMRLVRVKTNASDKPSRLYLKGKAV